MHMGALITVHKCPSLDSSSVHVCALGSLLLIEWDTVKHKCHMDN